MKWETLNLAYGEFFVPGTIFREIPDAIAYRFGQWVEKGVCWESDGDEPEPAILTRRKMVLRHATLEKWLMELDWLDNSFQTYETFFLRALWDGVETYLNLSGIEAVELGFDGMFWGRLREILAKMCQVDSEAAWTQVKCEIKDEARRKTARRVRKEKADRIIQSLRQKQSVEFAGTFCRDVPASGIISRVKEVIAYARHEDLDALAALGLPSLGIDDLANERIKGMALTRLTGAYPWETEDSADEKDTTPIEAFWQQLCGHLSSEGSLHLVYPDRNAVFQIEKDDERVLVGTHPGHYSLLLKELSCAEQAILNTAEGDERHLRGYLRDGENWEQLERDVLEHGLRIDGQVPKGPLRIIGPE